MSDKSSHGLFFLDLLLFVDITNHFLWSDYTIAKHRLQVGILKKKAIENKKHAKELAKSVDEIVTYYVELREAAKKYNASISAVFIKYEEYLIRIEGIVEEKTDWKKYNHEEKTAVKNAAMLTGFLRDMVYTKLIIQQNDNETLETVNNQEVSALKRKADKLLKNI